MTWLVSLSVGSMVSTVLASNPPAPHAAALQPASSCRVTIEPAPPFVAPAPYPAKAPSSRAFWYGSDTLWTMLDVDGTWHSLPRNPDGFRQKVFWWSPGFDGRLEPRPELRVSGRRLDGRVSFANPAPATNAHHLDFGGWAILTGIDVPTAGCWELTGTYRNQSVTFVVWIPGTAGTPQ